ncbi:MAG: hypothetical protein HY913_03880 [Desulfomonile tiedjei]|nr:hypothetical protein [Desulfomonile tiedjei]
MTRVLVVLLILSAILFAVLPTQTVALEPGLMQDFDRNACYAKCPCSIVGMEQACFECKQRCEREYWKAFDKEAEEDEK